jgi:hypothetical protein
MAGLIVRAATRADIDGFSDLASKPSIRGIVGEVDGRVIGMGGLALSRGRWFAFCDLTPEARAHHKVAIVRAAKRIVAEARRDGIRFIYWEADPSEPRAMAWARSLGFTLDQRSLYFYRWSA